MSELSVRATIPEDVMLARLAQSEQMREFCIQMWLQNPALAKQGGAKVRSLLSPLERGMASEPTRAPSGAGMEKQCGVSLIELIMFIVIVSTALAGIMLVMNVTTRNSADPLVHKQALAIAESLLEEVELMPFTFCDPDDPAAETATGVGDCAVPEVLGAENDVSRYDAALPFDNVSDYHGFAMNGGAIFDITDGATKIPGLDSYILAPIVVAPIAFGGITLASGNALQITVTVTGPDGVPVTVDGIRTRYAPRALP
jgi:MSHA pilin protein MshD